jgi:hypothetical protein
MRTRAAVRGKRHPQPPTTLRFGGISVDSVSTRARTPPICVASPSPSSHMHGLKDTPLAARLGLPQLAYHNCFIMSAFDWLIQQQVHSIG